MSLLAIGPEFDRIRGLARVLGPAASGLGDDCAFIDVGGEVLALSADLSVENVHFRREWLSFSEIGWRATAAALSDLAAVGAEAIGVLTAVGMPVASLEADIQSVMAGVGAAVNAVAGKVLGGDLSASPVWVIDVTVIGRAARPVRRVGATPGDGVWVTGRLGGARAALQSWVGGQEPPAELRNRFARPLPRIAAGRWLASWGARAMIDLSDGLAGDARHLAAASACTIELDLDSVPVGEGVAPVAARLGEDARAFAAAGGEDYELLVVLPPDFVESHASAFEESIGISLTQIGRVHQGEGTRLRLAGREVTISGFDHFR